MATAFATDTQRLSNVLKFEYNEIPGFCRKAINVIETGAQTYNPGQILVRSITSPVATATAKSGNTGTGSIGTVTAFSTASLGTYNLRIVAAASNAGTFVVTSPSGLHSWYGTVGVAFLNGGLSFTLADATDFVVGDEISIVVTGTEVYSIPTADKVDGTLVMFISDKTGNAGPTAIPAGGSGTTVIALVRGPARVASTGLLVDASIDTAAELAAVYAILEGKNIQVDTQI